MNILIKSLDWIFDRFLEIMIIPVTIIGVAFSFYVEDIRSWNDFFKLNTDPVHITYLKEFANHCQNYENYCVNLLPLDEAKNKSNYYHLIVIDRTISTDYNNDDFTILVQRLKDELEDYQIDAKNDLKKLIINNLYKSILNKPSDNGSLKVSYYDGQKELKEASYKSEERMDWISLDKNDERPYFEILFNEPVYQRIENQKTDINEVLQGAEELLKKQKGLEEKNLIVTIISDFDHEDNNEVSAQKMNILYANNSQLNLINIPSVTKDRTSKSEKVYKRIKNYSEGLVNMTTLKIRDFSNDKITPSSEDEFCIKINRATKDIKESEDISLLYYFNNPYLGEIGKSIIHFNNDSFRTIRWKIEPSFPFNYDYYPTGTYTLSSVAHDRDKFWINSYQKTELSPNDTLLIQLNKNSNLINQSMNLYVETESEIKKQSIRFLKLPSTAMVSAMNFGIKAFIYFLLFVAVGFSVFWYDSLINRNKLKIKRFIKRFMAFLITAVIWFFFVRGDNLYVDLLFYVVISANFVIAFLYALIHNKPSWVN